MKELHFYLSELLQMSDDEWEVMVDAIADKVKEYCNAHDLDWNKIDYEYDVSVNLRVKEE